MTEVLLDTDTLSMFLRNQPSVMAEADHYLQVHSGFTFSVITHFEILRGLKVKSASRQVEKFKLICEESREINLSAPIVVKAAELYAGLHRTGKIIGDADILIAATALEHDLPIVTNNTSHFSRIKGLTVLNWNQ
jgi:tRNA(fMet)-specific endonuclease VapC